MSDLRRDCGLARQALPYTGPTGSASLSPLASSVRSTAAVTSTSVSTTITSGGTTRTTVLIAGVTTGTGGGGNTLATLTATPVNQENAAATGAGKPLAGAAAAGILAAVAAMA